MRALGFEPKKEEIKKMISDIDKDGSGIILLLIIPLLHHFAILGQKDVQNVLYICDIHVHMF